MDGIGVVGPIGKWDQDLFMRFRRARKGRQRGPGQPPDPAGALRRALLDALIRVNTPLVKTLVHQVRGNAPPEGARRRVRTSMHLVGARDIEWEIALNLGRFACAKALESFDPAKGSFSGYLLKKVFYELQCEVGRQNMIRVDRGARPVGLDYLEDDEHLGRLELEDDEHYEEEPPQIARLEQLEETIGEPLASPPPAAAAALPIIVPAPPDDRPAIQVFLEDHCTFAPTARAVASQLAGRWHALARALEAVERRGELARELRARGVQDRINMRVPWSPTPVKGFAGVRLQNDRRDLRA